MIRYSHVSLLISCDADSATTITATLGVQPSRVRENKLRVQLESGGWEERVHHTWVLDSPKSHTDGAPTARLYALADIIEPFAARLPSLRPQFRPLVDVIYHITPQDPHGITGEFDWFCLPADLMRRYSAWDLSISYETFWFDHPDWVCPARRGWWRRLMESVGLRRRDAC